jgi:hypothetical protein
MSDQTAQIYPTNHHGQRPSWAGTWGPLGDQRSKLARLAARIEREILTERGLREALSGKRRAFTMRQIRLAAKHLALLEQAIDVGFSDQIQLNHQSAAERLLESITPRKPGLRGRRR